MGTLTASPRGNCERIKSLKSRMIVVESILIQFHVGIWLNQSFDRLAGRTLNLASNAMIHLFFSQSSIFASHVCSAAEYWLTSVVFDLGWVECFMFVLTYYSSVLDSFPTQILFQKEQLPDRTSSSFFQSNICTYHARAWMKICQAILWENLTLWQASSRQQYGGQI